MFVKRFVQHRKNQLAAVVEERAENVVIRGTDCHKTPPCFLFIVAQNGEGDNTGKEKCVTEWSLRRLATATLIAVQPPKSESRLRFSHKRIMLFCFSRLGAEDYFETKALIHAWPIDSIRFLDCLTRRREILLIIRLLALR